MFSKFLLVLALVTVAVAVIARTSSGHEPERVYVVRPADTLWSIAAAKYGGDPREAVWKIQRRNHLEEPLLRPGARLILP
jgi:LysM domain-containing protein